jgi:hypothetical protein
MRGKRRRGWRYWLDRLAMWMILLALLGTLFGVVYAVSTLGNSRS